jgi:transposase
MKILALDLGKNKSVVCALDTTTNGHAFETIRTQPQEMHDLIVERRPDRVVIEIGPQAGWVHDLMVALDVAVQVANPNHDAWRWRNVKSKTDRMDALKLAQLSSMNQLPTVHVPTRSMRQWRHLISYRHKLVRRRTAIKNHLRGIVTREGESSLMRTSKWTNTLVKWLESLARPMEEVEGDEVWRGVLGLELEALADVCLRIQQVEDKLDALAAVDPRVGLVRSIPGVGPRLAELVVATIDDPHRFQNGKQVGAYAGLTPRQYQSGTMDRKGRISGQGNALLRALLVEVSWLGLRYNAHVREVYERVRQGSESRKKVAIIAVARRLLIWCWAMLRDHRRWNPPDMSRAAVGASVS